MKHLGKYLLNSKMNILFKWNEYEEKETGNGSTNGKAKTKLH
jgi:hypothetical protein